MSWQTEKLAEQAEADALFTMGGAEWRDTYEEYDTHVYCPFCKKGFTMKTYLKGYKDQRTKRYYKGVKNDN